MDRNKKIRLLSFQNAQNFGAILQAYGLQTTIRDLGYSDVKFLNYNPKYLKDRYLVFKWKQLLPTFNPWYLLSHYVNLPFAIINEYRRNRIFNKSRRSLIYQTTKELHSVEDLNGIECDCLICGSDQIWSTWITGVPDPVFYAEGKYLNKPYAFSYAPSTELSTFDNAEHVELIKKYLNNFNSVSVREESVQKYLKHLTGKEIELCVDPTILCGKESYSKIALKNEIRKKYILVYAYDNYASLIQNIVKTIPGYRSYEIHYLSFCQSNWKNTFSSNNHAEVSVEKFVSLFKYADYVVTNSFHGLAFSLLFEKDFYVAYESGLSARVESLLKQIGCYDRLVKKSFDCTWNKLDYSIINNKLEELRGKSRKFILDNLSKI